LRSVILLLGRLMSGHCKYDWHLFPGKHRYGLVKRGQPLLEETMKTWSKPEVREQEVGLEVTSYLPAEIDLI
jgi:coenzyme PQQ precursor peptide PqqA